MNDMDTILSESIGFNTNDATTMLLDINSCFATIEQQANPLLRGRPVVVGAYTTDKGCVLASSREAKKLGIKTGMFVGDAKKLCSKVVILSPDSNKYRFINKKLESILSRFTDPIVVKSIDEMTFSFRESYTLERLIRSGLSCNDAMWHIALTIKQTIKEELGDWITVSIGIAPNRYLAKTAASYQKPDGLVRITSETIIDILSSMKLEDLCGIKQGNAIRLRSFGIMTPLQFYNATIAQLKGAFHSIVGYHWWLRLHGWEADDKEFERKSIGHSYALRSFLSPQSEDIKHILYQLVVKMGRRVRNDNLTAEGVHVSCFFSDGTHWRLSEKQSIQLFTDTQFYEAALRLLNQSPDIPIRILAVSCFSLQENLYTQQTLFHDYEKERKLTQALDSIAKRWGEWTVVPGRLLSIDQRVHDRIAFGSHHSIAFAMKHIPVGDF